MDTNKTEFIDSIKTLKTKNILFSLSAFSFEEHFGRYSKGGFKYNYQEGIACIAAAIRKKGYNASFHDADFDGPFDILLQRIEKENIGLIGFPCYTVDLKVILQTSEILKKKFPSLIIVIGNVHPSNYPKEVLKLAPYIDYIVIGEAENNFCDLLDALSNNGNIPTVEGLGWRENGTFNINPYNAKPDINNLPPPAYDIFPMQKYSLQPTLVKKYPTYTLMASRGCPFNCAFCDVKSMMGKKVRYRSPEAVVSIMKNLATNYNARGFAFQDSTLTVSKKWISEFCKAYKKSGLNLPWMAYSRVDTITPEMVAEIKDAGCWCLSFGMESGNQKTLDLLNKKTTVEQNIEAGRMTIKAGLVLQTTFIVCLPGEDENDAINTYRFAKDVGAHVCRFFLPTPYPKTKLYDICVNDGMSAHDPHDSYRYDFLNYGDDLPYVNPRIGASRMIELVSSFEKKYYLSSKVLLRNLMQFRSFDDLKKYFVAFRAVYGI